MAKFELKLKDRFEVFKRDNFTCQYCGRKVPEVVLELDHIIPKSKLGIDTLENYITSCFDCNRGKGDRLLTDKKTRDKIQENLKELQERESQLKEYSKFIKAKQRRIKKDIDEISDKWSFLAGKESLFSEKGRLSIKRLLANFTKEDIMEAMELSIKVENLEGRFKYMCGILWTWKRDGKDKHQHF